MSMLTIENNRCRVTPLYQWDKNRYLEICGLSLASAPRIHFANSLTGEAIVKQSTMDAEGIVKVQIPNVLLRQAENIKAYIYVHDGETCETYRDLTIPIIGRAKPSDYITPDDDPTYDPTVGTLIADHDGAGNVTLVIGG